MVALTSMSFGAVGVLMPLRLRGLGVAEVGIAGARARTQPAGGRLGWVTSLTLLSAAVERVGRQSGVALGLFNLDWAASQMLGAIGGAQLSWLGSGVPFIALVAAYALALARSGSAAPGRGGHGVRHDEGRE